MAHRYAVVLVALGLTCYAVVLAANAREGTPSSMSDGHSFPWLADKPVGEDGFYMLTVARNLARGHGLTYTPGTPTTGIQPLATFAYAALYWACDRLGGSDWTFVRSVIVVGTLNLLLLGHVVGAVFLDLYPDEDPTFRGVGYALCFALVALNATLFRLFTYGLETGLYLALLALCVRYSIRLLGPAAGGGGRRFGQVVLLGVLAGVTAWGRIDFGVVFGCFVGICVLRRQLSVPEAAACGATALLVLSPWLAYVHAVSGKWLPSSGPAQAALVSSADLLPRLRTMVAAFAAQAAPWMFHSAGLVPALASLAVLFVAVGYAARDARSRAAVGQAVSRAGVLVNWAAATGALFVVYLVFFWASHFYSRYTTPFAIPAALLLAIALAEGLRRRPARVKLVPVAVMAVCFAGWTFAGMHRGRINNTHVVSAGFVQRHFPRARVGCWQSGVIGFLSPNAVNLDGKVNTAALAAARTNDLAGYLDREGIDVLIDWQDVIEDALPREYLARQWERSPMDVGNGVSVCYVRRVPTARAGG